MQLTIIASMSLHEKVLWDDMVSLEPVSSARRFINLFFVDQAHNVSDAVVAVRLPYDRVNINGTDPFTFSSNDVVRVRLQQGVLVRLAPTFQKAHSHVSEGLQSRPRSTSATIYIYSAPPQR